MSNLHDIEEEPRQIRLARKLISESSDSRTAAGYDNPCFQMFLWYPLPSGHWDILFSQSAAEYHLYLWESKGIHLMAEAWGINASDLGSGIGIDSIPTGYIDFEERNNREFMVLIVPEQLPPGWSTSRLKLELRCGSSINVIRPTSRRNADPQKVYQLISILQELQRERPKR